MLKDVLIDALGFSTCWCACFVLVNEPVFELVDEFVLELVA